MSNDVITDCLASLERPWKDFANKKNVKSLERLKVAFDEAEYVSAENVQRILDVLQYCLKDNMTNISNALAVVTSLLKVKNLPKLPVQDYMPTALGLLNLIKTVCVKRSVETFRSMTINLFLSYPVEVITEIVRCSCTDILDVFIVYRSSKPDYMSKEMCNFLYKLLLLLPAEQSLQFAKEGTEIWFGDLIPTLMTGMTQEDRDNYLIYLISIEILTKDLLLVDYQNSPKWNICLKQICHMREYPAAIMKLLKSQNDMWYRVWIVLIKLLKGQITQNISGFKTPINSMLPPVEAAFKLDLKERCRAFQCWEALIDTLSREISESCLPKRMKLLLIPLRSNNAKFGEIALAKLNCWWYLISMFAEHLDKFLSEVLLPFLTFAFGKKGTKLVNSTGVAEQFDSICRDKCIEAFVNIIGHHNCHCNTTLAHLKSPVLTSKILLSHWPEWSYALKMAITLSADDTTLLGNENPMPVLCAFKQIVLLLAKLPNNVIRKEVFNELIIMLNEVVLQNSQKSTVNQKFVGVVFCVTLSLFDDEKYEEILTTNIGDPPLKFLFSLILNENTEQVFSRYSPEDMIKTFKPMTNFLIRNASIAYFLNSMLDDLNNHYLPFWTALAESIYEQKSTDLDPQIVNKMILRPVKDILKFYKNDYAGMAWFKLYNQLEIIASQSNEEIMQELMSSRELLSTNYFMLCITVSLLKNKLTKEKKSENIAFLAQKCEALTHYSLSMEMNDPLLPELIDSFGLLMLNAINEGNSELAEIFSRCALTFMTLLNEAAFKSVENNGQQNIETHLTNLFVVIQKMFQVSYFTGVSTVFVNKLFDYLIKLNKESPLYKFVVTKLKKCTVCNQIQHLIDHKIQILEGNEKNEDVKTNKTAQEFTIPQQNEVVKKVKKKGANIVNTVVENGEEYVVVKSNWKFNPRKLTENQKEKLQRKREDIPALYQDLSQSQEEFKLSTWKPDSQDTTNSKSSKSSISNEVSNALKNIDSSDVIPTIMENILSENEANLDKEQTLLKNKECVEKKELAAKSCPKNENSPRLALKDRVFRNVKYLLENSKAKGDMKERPENKDQINEVSSIGLCITPPTQQTKINTKEKVEVKSAINDVSKINVCTSLAAGVKQNGVTEKIEHIGQLNPDVCKTPLADEKNSNTEKKHEEKDTTNLVLNVADSITLSVKDKKSDINEKPEVSDKVLNLDGDKTPTEKETKLDAKENTEDKNKTNLILNVGVGKTSSGETNPDLNVGSKTPSAKEKKNNTKQKHEEKDKFNKVSKLGVCKTPIILKEKNNKSMPNSAPPLIIDRPTRKRKIPIKFNDVELFGMPKRSNSQCSFTESRESHENDTLKDKLITVVNKENDNVNSKNVDLCDKITLCQEIPDNNEAQNVFSNLHTEVQVVIKREGENDFLDGPLLENKANTENLYVSLKTSDVVINNATSASTIDNEIVEENVNPIPNKEDSDILTESSQASPNNLKEPIEQKATAKKTKTPGRKKSRIEKELAIDMVEGHPFLQIECAKRLTRRKTVESCISKSNIGKEKPPKTTPKGKQSKHKETGISAPDSQPLTPLHVEETQEKSSSPVTEPAYDGPLCSEDVIESSQDSTFTAISVKSTKQTTKQRKALVVMLERTQKSNVITHTQDLLQDSDCEIISQSNKSVMQETKDDVELPQNKTADVDKNQSELTENMDTEPMSAKTVSQDVILISEELTPVMIDYDTEAVVGSDTLELAEADTQPNNPDFEASLCNKTSQKLVVQSGVTCSDDVFVNHEDITQMDTEPLNESTIAVNKESELSTDEEQRKRDFLNDTSEISPIKMQSPEREKTPSPEETSSDYVVVKLSAPVEINGEPFDKSDSPEFFTEDKISPEKREQSPPRADITVNTSSPTSVLSLKKNRPQVRSGGRAAHMLGLCVPESLNAIKNIEKPESEEVKRSSSTSTPARRNLRLLYNAANEAADDGSDTEDDNFLNFKKTLPSSDCSPSVPILKRKLADIADDTTASPANKRKRVSFHDPPVSTTVSVQKYIESGTKSPSSAHKRVERIMTRNYSKSPKRLEFKPNTVQLNTALGKAVESFTEEQLLSLTNDTMDVTPAVEVVKTSELNDTDPICPELVECKDDIEKIATELSSPAMRDLFIRELEGRVATVGDLAKMTELEVNRLCIKAPKVQVAKKVLKDYVNKRQEPKTVAAEVSITETALSKEMDEEMTEQEPKRLCVEMQTDKVSMSDSQMQTITQPVTEAVSQTDVVSVATTSTQTKEITVSTADLITSCLSERDDFIDQLSEVLNEESLRKIANNLSTDAVIDILGNDPKLIFNKILDRYSQTAPSDEKNRKELKLISDYLLSKYDDRGLILFCSQLLQRLYDKPVIN